MKMPESAALRRFLPGDGIPIAPSLSLVGMVEDGSGNDYCFQDSRWEVFRAPSCLEFLIEAHRKPHCIVVCDRDLADGNWKDIVAAASSLPSPPPVIVTSRLADECLWAEVLHLGGFDVLAKPFHLPEVARALDLAWMHWVNRASLTKGLRGGFVWKRGQCSAV